MMGIEREGGIEGLDREGGVAQHCEGNAPIVMDLGIVRGDFQSGVEEGEGFVRLPELSEGPSLPSKTIGVA